MKRFFLSVLTIAILLQSSVGAGSNAYAAEEATSKSSMSPGTRKALIVAKGAAFGLGGGLVVGLASQVFKKNTKNIFLFGSLGMYVGIGLGLYVIMAPRGTTPYEGPDTYEDYTGQLNRMTKPESELQQLASAKDPSRVDVNLYSVKF
jgi:hypothetical protein